MNNLSLHPILIHQKKEANLVLTMANDLIKTLKTKRSDLIDPILVDVVIKLFRKFCCEIKDCNDCSICDPSDFMTEERFKEFISQKKFEIIKTIESGFNNSFSVPQRGLIFQYVIDHIFGNNDNLIVFEIGCGGGLIGKVLTNSNYSKKYFKNNPLAMDLKPDNRFVQYYGIDPNLTLNFKNQLMMINGDSEEMKIGRQTLINFLKDDNFSNDNIHLNKLYLTVYTVEHILFQINNMISKINNKYPIKIIFITSMMKYHFNSKKEYVKFMNNIVYLTNKINIKFGINKIDYISNEVYGSNCLLYPIESKEYNRLIVKNNKIINSKFVHEKVFLELTHLF